MIVIYCTKSESKTFITQSSIACFNCKLKWPKDAHHCFSCSNTACHSINCLFLWGGGTECHGKVGNTLVSNFIGYQDQILAPSQAVMYFLTPTKQTAGSVHNQVVATPAKFLPFHCSQTLSFEAIEAVLLAASLNN